MCVCVFVCACACAGGWVLLFVCMRVFVCACLCCVFDVLVYVSVCWCLWCVCVLVVAYMFVCLVVLYRVDGVIVVCGLGSHELCLCDSLMCDRLCVCK